MPKQNEPNLTAAFLLENVGSGEDLPSTSDKILGLNMTKNVINDIRKDSGKMNLPRHEKLKTFLELGLDKLKIPHKTLLEGLNTFIRQHSKKAPLLKQESDFKPDHLAAFYSELSAKGFIAFTPGMDELEGAFIDAQYQIGMINKLEHFTRKKFGRIGRETVDNAEDAARNANPVAGARERVAGAREAIQEQARETIQQSTRRKTTAGRIKEDAGALIAGAGKTSDAIRKIPHDKIVAEGGRRELRIFLKGALRGINNDTIPDGDEKAILKSLEKFLKQQEFDKIPKSLNELTAEQLGAVFEKAAEKKLFDSKKPDDLTPAWDSLREKLGIPEGLKMAATAAPVIVRLG